MIGTFEKNNVRVKAVQWDGTEKSLKEVEKLLGEHKDRISTGYYHGLTTNLLHMELLVKSGKYEIYITNWIVKDDKYFFCVSNDIFQNMFKRIKK